MQKIEQEDIKNILNLISRVSDIKGAEALAVAVLQQKLQGMLKEEQVIEKEVTKKKND